MNTTSELQRFSKRSLTCGIGILCLFFIVFIRLIYLQIVEHRFYETLSNRNVISVVPVKPNRGLIYDRNGILLANNIPVYSLMLIPARVRDIGYTLNQLKDVVGLTDDEIKNFKRIEKQYYPYQAVPIKQQLTEAQVDSFYVKQYEFPGVLVQTNMVRNYPLGKATGDVVGYVGRITANELAQVDPANYTASDDVGKSGVEAEDEILLHGTMGSEQAEIDANGKIVRVLKTTPAISGDNIYLTIDSKLQAFAEKALGKNAGAIVAIQPATGQVLALVSKPTFDPNMFVTGMSETQYQSVINNPEHPLFNRAIRATYAPGSTVKPFIAFYALNNSIINTNDTIFDPGYYQLPHTTHIFKNWVHTGFGWVNVTKAIEVSCDTFFYQLAVTLGIDRLDQALTQFGFGQLTGINLPDERAGIVPTPAWKMKTVGQAWYEGDTVVAGIGQGYITTTPLQLAAATATIAERGLKYQPTVLSKLQQPDGLITVMQPIPQEPIIANNSNTWNVVIEGMQSVTSNPQGTAYPSFSNAPYTSAGKTGTAQVYDKNRNNQAGNSNKKQLRKLQNNHLFICFAPVNNPQIAVVVVVEHIHGMTQRAVQIARQLTDFYMQELKQEHPTQISNAAPAVLPAPQENTTLSTINTATDANENTTQPLTPTTPMKQPLPSPDNKEQINNALRTNLPKTIQKKNHAVPAELQQQMETGLDTQLDVQTQKMDQKNATSNSQ